MRLRCDELTDDGSRQALLRTGETCRDELLEEVDGTRCGASGGLNMTVVVEGTPIDEATRTMLNAMNHGCTNW